MCYVAPSVIHARHCATPAHKAIVASGSLATQVLEASSAASGVHPSLVGPHHQPALPIGFSMAPISGLGKSRGASVSGRCHGHGGMLGQCGFTSTQTSPARRRCLGDAPGLARRRSRCHQHDRWRMAQEVDASRAGPGWARGGRGRGGRGLRKRVTRTASTDGPLRPRSRQGMQLGPCTARGGCSAGPGWAPGGLGRRGRRLRKRVARTASTDRPLRPRGRQRMQPRHLHCPARVYLH
jgi:hypothetical protein